MNQLVKEGHLYKVSHPFSDKFGTCTTVAASSRFAAAKQNRADIAALNKMQLQIRLPDRSRVVAL